MKILAGLLVLLVSSVTAEYLSDFEDLEFEHALDEFLEELNLLQLANTTKDRVTSGDHPHAHLNVVQLGELYNYGVELHTVATKDGYFLEMHRFTGNQKNINPRGKQPVLLVHGILCSSMDWTIAGPGKALAFILADLGYDVWMGNVRGNRYSRRHQNNSITKEAMWDFSFHEMGIYDLPTMIDHILKNTVYEQIIYVGHSQGSSAFLAMLSERPEYNDKVMTMFSLAPVAFCSHIKSPVFRMLAAFNPVLEIVRKFFGKYEFSPTGEFFRKFTSLFCSKTSLTQPICTNIMFMICGFSDELMDKELLPAILAHLPAGSSTKQFIHYSQLVKSGQFRQFDYGWWTNLDKYGSFNAPLYNFDNMKVPISLHYSANDWLSSVQDVEMLYQKLPNPIGKFRVPHSQFNHLDFLWGKNVKTLLYDRMISIMKRQEKLYAKKKANF